MGFLFDIAQARARIAAGEGTARRELLKSRQQDIKIGRGVPNGLVQARLCSAIREIHVT